VLTSEIKIDDAERGSVCLSILAKWKGFVYHSLNNAFRDKDSFSEFNHCEIYLINY